MPNFNVQIWHKVGKPPMEFSIEAANIYAASDHVHKLKKYKADTACEIHIKGEAKKNKPAEIPEDVAAQEAEVEFAPEEEVLGAPDDRQTSVIPDA